MTDESLALLKGTVDILILAALAEGQARHGYGIAEWIDAATRGTFLLEEGTLYPALHRLQRKGLLQAEWGASANNRRAKFYRLTARGEAQRKRAADEWERYTAAVAAALSARGGA